MWILPPQWAKLLQIIPEILRLLQATDEPQGSHEFYVFNQLLSKSTSAFGLNSAGCYIVIFIDF